MRLQRGLREACELVKYSVRGNYAFELKVFGLGNKAWTLICKKERSELKEGRNKGMVITKSLWRVAEWPPSRLNVGSPKVTELEDAEGQSKKAMELTKGRIVELIGEPDLLR
uniref:Uncharacterized protein n=1 Tax=Solanum tuberosum TaxID=4113 RepID=M1DS17_SOLTU